MSRSNPGDDGGSLERLRRALERNSTDPADVKRAKEAAEQVLRDEREGRISLSSERREKIERMVQAQNSLLKGGTGCGALLVVALAIAVALLLHGVQ